MTRLLEMLEQLAWPFFAVLLVVLGFRPFGGASRRA
jgi:hypothetical protein